MHKSLLMIVGVALLGAGGGAMNAVHAAQPAVATVTLSNFKFAPAQIDLQANAPTVLQLRNESSGGHDFSAPAFFAAARIDPASAALVRDGKVEIPAHATLQIGLTPAAGKYPLKCSHTFHAMFGMKGTILVH